MSSSSNNSKITSFIKESKNLAIPLRVIKKATKKFTKAIGKGGYGSVYKGELLLSSKLTSVAVKRLDSNISGQGFKEFLTEIQLLSRYKHPNVVSLVGFCDEAGEKILVYEYAEHGSLDKHLSVAKTARPLTWEQRISICLDTARALDFLHNHIATNHRVIHRDIKSANILIGHDWKAMIADLGLSKIGRANENDSYLITNACGTQGYLDPAYMDTGILTKESDIYSFGVVMFEVLCGRLCFIKADNEHRFLARLAPRYYETGRLSEIIDPYLKSEVDPDSLKRFSEIAYPCLLNERDQRPSMGSVVQKLEEMMPSSKVLQINAKVRNLRLLETSDQTYYLLGHKTENISDVYALGEKLGGGQFSATYICTEFATGIDYALKSISKRKLISKEDVKNVRRQIQIMHHLAGHKNIVMIKGTYEDALNVYIVMELCPGGKLFDRIIQRGHYRIYSERKAAELTKTIVGVVEACHSLGVMLRDLNPDNFLLVTKDDDFSIKAFDFGLSVFFKPGQIFADVVGSPYYMAPEVVLLRKYYSPEANVWSAGVILYILLSGVPPFWANTEQGISEAVLKGYIDFESDPWPLISESAKDLIRKMLCSRPSDRLTAYEVLCHPWICENEVAPDRAPVPVILSRLKQFSTMKKLKKMALRVIAKSLSEEEIAGLRKMFKGMDTDNNGEITFYELKAGLRKFGSTINDTEIQDLMDAVDVDNSGTIDYGEFLAATIHLNKLEREEHLVAAFQYFDMDGSGYITVDELQKACADHNMTDFIVEDIIREVDQDKDGKIGYGEFVAMMRKEKAGELEEKCRTGEHEHERDTTGVL